MYENLHTTDVAGADLNASWKNSLGMTGLGFETRLESIHGTWTRNGEHSLSNLNGYQRKEAGVFAEHRFNVGRFEATPGLYAGYYSDFGWNAFPGLDIGYTLSKRFRFYATAGRSFRVPDFYDMYYDSPVEKGSRDLVPERATGYEAGIKYFSSVVSGGVNIFRQTSRNLIDWVQVPATDSTYYWQAKNVTRLARTGFEIGMNFDFSRLAGPAPWVRKIGLSYNYLLSDLGNSGYISRYVLDNLKDQFVAGINHRIAWEIFHDFNIQYNRREGIRGYWVLDSRIYWDHGGKPLIFAEATNWTGTRYTEVMVPMPGRWIRAGIEYNFGL